MTEQIGASQGARASDPLNRRGFLKLAASGAGAVGLGAALTACSSSSSPSTSTTSGATTTTTISSSTPRRGGVLTAGLGGGTSSDTLDAHGGVNTLDFGRLNQLYNCLVEYKADGLLRLALAEEVTPSSKATTWTIRLREGVEFHNGKLLTADDIVYNFRRITNPKKPFTGAARSPRSLI